MTREWIAGHIPGVRRGWILTDGGDSIIKAVHDGGFVGIWYMAYALHLVEKDALGQGDKSASSHSSIREVMGRKRAGHFNRIVKGNKLLQRKKEFAGVSHCFLMQDVSMRCNSTEIQLERLLEQSAALHEVARVADIGIEAPQGCAL